MLSYYTDNGNLAKLALCHNGRENRRLEIRKYIVWNIVIYSQIYFAITQEPYFNGQDTANGFSKTV